MNDSIEAKTRKPVPRYTLERAILLTLGRRSQGQPTSVILTDGVAAGSTTSSVHQCLRRLQKRGKIIRTKHGWKIAASSSVITDSSDNLMSDDLRMAIVLAAYHALPADKRKKIDYLSRVIDIKKVGRQKI